MSHLPLGSCLYILEELKQDAQTPNPALFLTTCLPFCHILKDLTISFLYSTSNYLFNAALGATSAFHSVLALQNASV